MVFFYDIVCNGCLCNKRHRADAGGEQSRAEGVVPRAGGVQGDEGTDVAYARDLRRAELRGRGGGVGQAGLDAVG